MATLAFAVAISSSSSATATSFSAATATSFNAMLISASATEESRISRSTPSVSDESQAYYWTPAWQKAEAEAELHIASGRVMRFGSIDEAIAWLDNE